MVLLRIVWRSICKNPQTRNGKARRDTCGERKTNFSPSIFLAVFFYYAWSELQKSLNLARNLNLSDDKEVMNWSLFLVWFGYGNHRCFKHVFGAKRLENRSDEASWNLPFSWRIDGRKSLLFWPWKLSFFWPLYADKCGSFPCFSVGCILSRNIYFVSRFFAVVLLIRQSGKVGTTTISLFSFRKLRHHEKIYVFSHLQRDCCMHTIFLSCCALWPVKCGPVYNTILLFVTLNIPPNP